MLRATGTVDLPRGEMGEEAYFAEVDAIAAAMFEAGLDNIEMEWMDEEERMDQVDGMAANG